MSRISRFDFLRGDFSGKRIPIRPPWAHHESLFIEKCTRCNECISACPEQILASGRGGYPTVNFKVGECTFCGDCVVACKDGALVCVDEEFDDRTAWSIKASIQSSCLAFNGVECRVCGEHCESRAIRFQLMAGQVAKPQLDEAQCNGCGACIAVCPTDAMLMISPDVDVTSTDNDLATAVQQQRGLCTYPA